MFFTISLPLAAPAVRILPYLARLRDELGTPIVYVTHDLAEVALFADEVVGLEEGRVVQHAARAEWQDPAGAMTPGAS